MSDLLNAALSKLSGRDDVNVEYFLLSLIAKSNAEVQHRLNMLESQYEMHLELTGSIEGAEDVRELIHTLRLRMTIAAGSARRSMYVPSAATDPRTH